MFKGIDCRYTSVDEYATLLKEREDRIKAIKAKEGIIPWNIWKIHEKIADEAYEKCGRVKKNG